MEYYNPKTKETLSYKEVCSLYNTSFPTASEVLAGTWYMLHETDLPAPEDGYRFEPGEVALVDGNYVKTWKKVPLTAEEQESLAQTAALSFISSNMARTYIQAASFSAGEFALFSTAGLFDEWAPDVQYSKGFRLVCDGVVYEVQQDVLSVESQPPFAEGMLAVYRPLSVDPETGEEPDGSREHPFAFLYGMDVTKDSYYSYEGKLWLARADMPACVWVPGTAGMWQWEEVGAVETAVYTPGAV